MIDRKARTKVAGLLREFANGVISNEKFEAEYPVSNIDISIGEIFTQIWFLYSDVREHRLTGDDALNREQSKFVERCILFLKSDAEFEWPRQRISPSHFILSVLGFDRNDEQAVRGDESVWPFKDVTQYELALREIQVR